MKTILVFFAFMTFSVGSFADPLGVLPVIPDANLRVQIESQSDLWSQPYREKPSPVRIYNAQFRVPVFRAQNWEGAVDIGLEVLSLGRHNMMLDEDGVDLDGDFGSQNIGIALTREMPEDSSFSFSVTHASDSDKPFASRRDRWFEGSMLFRSASQGDSRWLVMLTQTPNRGFRNGQLFPYIGWMYTPGDDFELLLGFPFFRLTRTVNTEWVQIILLTPVAARLALERDLSDRFLLQMQALFSVRSYLHSDRLEDEERIFFEDKSIEAGLATTVNKATNLNFSFGYSLDRRLYKADSIFAPDGTTLKLNRDVYGRLVLEFQL